MVELLPLPWFLNNQFISTLHNLLFPVGGFLLAVTGFMHMQGWLPHLGDDKNAYIKEGFVIGITGGFIFLLGIYFIPIALATLVIILISKYRSKKVK